MEIPILKHERVGVKRYRYSALHLPIRWDKPVYMAFALNPDQYVERSIEEWSLFFGFEVQLANPDIPPSSIDWNEMPTNPT